MKNEVSKHKNTNRIALFDGEEIRRVIFDGKWYYAIEDVVRIISNSTNPKAYVKKLRQRDAELSKGWGQIVHPLPVQTKGGRQSVNCANTEGVFRLIQSIPSKRAEPFKRWLARVGKERLDEIEQPALAIERGKGYYIAGNITKEAIEKLERQTNKKVVTHKNAKALNSAKIKEELVQQSLPVEPEDDK